MKFFILFCSSDGLKKLLKLYRDAGEFSVEFLFIPFRNYYSSGGREISRLLLSGLSLTALKNLS